MNTLTIPQLNIFHTRRTSPTKRDFNYSKNTFIDTNNYQYLTRHLHNSRRDQQNLIHTIKRQLSSQSRYKQIAEDYLQKKSKLTPYFIQPTPYIYNIPSYLYQASPSRNTKYPCQCEIEDSYKPTSDRHLNRNPYVGLKEQKLPPRQQKILNQPYLQATFRQHYQSTNQQKPISKKNSSNQFKNQIKQQSNYTSKNFINEVANSKIMQKLKTHQSNDQEESKIGPINSLITQKNEVSIQTEKQKQSNIASKSHRSNKKSKESVQRILEQQKLLIQSLKVEFERQNQFQIDVQDLQTTKNDYIDRSKELLFKLNELADDKRQFSFIMKAFSNKKKQNVFSSLEV